jgi:hypothetical protein
MITAILDWKFRAANGYAYAFATFTLTEDLYDRLFGMGDNLPKVFLVSG